MKNTLKILVVGLACCGSQHAAWAADEAGAGSPRFEKVVVRSDANFDFDKSAVRPEDATKILDELAKAGKVNWQSVNAVGYTDNVGTREYNQALSVRRANAIKTLLVDKGRRRSHDRDRRQGRSGPRRWVTTRRRGVRRTVGPRSNSKVFAPWNADTF